MWIGANDRNSAEKSGSCTEFFRSDGGWSRRGLCGQSDSCKTGNRPVSWVEFA